MQKLQDELEYLNVTSQDLKQKSDYQNKTNQQFQMELQKIEELKRSSSTFSQTGMHFYFFVQFLLKSVFTGRFFCYLE